ncbi:MULTISPECIES: LysR family transcriptional regulator [Dyella]|uniref:LysR family transcriptional regulator n=2 Tax=Dyella TaxID=231454 RepID=A0A4R0YRT9_9GAMM|nr:MULTISPECIES: LysR family transcriptional regulator [Dyella]TBR40507.1 LysR family transcriptional regulator [Dyella terrae]TCI11912.1 LysR family transcriptional regulator [Dyella soli]
MIDLDDMRLFVRAVTDGSLSAAGRELGLSPAVASKRLTRLEQALGVRLLQRSSRRLSLTSEGACYYERCVSILADVDEANAMVGRGQMEVRGALHVSASLDLGRQYIGPLAAQFTEQHPELRMRVSTSDAMLDVFEHGVDVAVRSGAMADSRLVSRRLALNYRVLCASPGYLRRRGTPASTDELEHHACLMLHRPGRGILPWMLQTAEGPKPMRLDAIITTDSGDLMRELAVAGHGIAFKSIWDIATDVEAGRLVPLLTQSAIQEAHIYAIYPSRDFLPARIRLFVDFLLERMREREGTVLGLLGMKV